MKIDYKKFIEDNFFILDRDAQTPIPFKFNVVQEKLYETIRQEYGADMEGVREIILKARQQGMSSFILALFTADFILRPYSVSICISHRKDATDILFKKVKFYLESYFAKLAKTSGLDPHDVEKQFLKTDNKGQLENAQNNATFYIGTAGARVGGRGGSARNILFSECAFYQDTELITAQEIVIGTAQQVPQGTGMIFIESTANGMGNYYQREWDRANEPPTRDGKRPSIYTPRFFGWNEFYSEDWVLEKKREFPTEKMWKQEYPLTPEEAFISSGSPFFNLDILKEMRDAKAKPLYKGRFLPDGSLEQIDIEEPPARAYRDLERGEQCVVFADPADSNDYCAAVVCSKKHYDFPIVFNEVMESSQFGYELYNLCKYVFNKTGMWPKLAIERNTGQATIFVLKNLNYPDLFRMVDFASQSVPYEKGQVGWTTTGHLSGGELRGTRRKMLDDFALSLRQGRVLLYDNTQIKQLMDFVIIKGRAQAQSNKHDDLVMATAGSWQIQELTPSIDLDNFDEETYQKEQEKWRFK